MVIAYFLTLRQSAATLALGALAALLGGATPAAAQSTTKPAWLAATVAGGGSSSGSSQVAGVAPDASGNLLVVGSFQGTAVFGSTTLTSAGSDDIFVAKYLAATDTWAWAVRAGGIYSDLGTAVAVRSGSVYVAGSIHTNRNNSGNVQFGSTVQYGIGTNTNHDAFLAKYTDQGSSAAFGWVQTAGGSGYDGATGVAASATGSSVYVVGNLVNNQANGNAVVFGASGAAAGTSTQAGAAAGSVSGDLFVAKYTDNGTTGSLGWTQVGGGTGDDQANGVAVSGSNVYVTGYLTNTRANDQGVLFGSTGTVPGTAPQYGASTNAYPDLVLAKYTDNGSTGSLGWTQVGGGIDGDAGLSVAASGSSIYVAGSLVNDITDYSQVRFGGSGTAAGTVAQAGTTAGARTVDLLLTKYTDNGATAALNWTQVGGGAGYDAGRFVAVSGNRVYVAGYLENSAANTNAAVFGGSGLAPGTAPQAGAAANVSYDLLAAGYVDNGASATLAWTQVGGGSGGDLGSAAAVVGTRLYVAGVAVPAATFGALAITAPAGIAVPCLGVLNLSATLATTATWLPQTSLWPNPASGPATLSGAAPATTGQVLDALGRLVAAFRTDARGTAALPGGLPAGLYLVRAGAGTVRWAVE